MSSGACDDACEWERIGASALHWYVEDLTAWLCLADERWIGWSAKTADQVEPVQLELPWTSLVDMTDAPWVIESEKPTQSLRRAAQGRRESASRNGRILSPKRESVCTF